MHTKPSAQQLAATVTDVLPATGLAYLAGEDGSDWTITKSTPGDGLAALAPGRRVDLTIEQHGRVRLVAAYTIPH